MKETYNLSHLLTYNQKTNRVYNWLNGEYVEFDDLEHPFLKILQSNTNSFEKFSHQDSFDDFEWLEEKMFVIQNRTVLDNMIFNHTQDKNSDKYLHLILLPAQLGCNFACKYCYEDHEQKQRMTSIEKNILLKYIQSLTNLEFLNIEWFGGEPLVNKDFILDFLADVQKISLERSIKFQSSMTTNGYYLTKELFQKLLNLNVRAYQITLDGIEEDHNKLRPLSNGGSTFQTILNNLLNITSVEDENFNIIVRTNFNENSKIIDYFELLQSLPISKDNRFSFIFRPIEDNFNDHKNDVACANNQSSLLQSLYEQMLKDKGLLTGDYMLYRDMGSHSCYASRENSLIVYPDMSIRKCTVALDYDKNIVGYISKDGELIKNSYFDLWTLNKNSIHNKSECLTCSFNPQCLSSACPLKYIQNYEISCPIDHSNMISVADNIISYLTKEANK